MRNEVMEPYRDPQSSRPAPNGMNAFGVVRYCFQYSSSTGRTRFRSIGNGGFQSPGVSASEMPGYTGGGSRSAPAPAVGTVAARGKFALRGSGTPRSCPTQESGENVA